MATLILALKTIGGAFLMGVGIKGGIDLYEGVKGVVSQAIEKAKCQQPQP